MLVFVSEGSGGTEVTERLHHRHHFVPDSTILKEKIRNPLRTVVVGGS